MNRVLKKLYLVLLFLGLLSFLVSSCRRSDNSDKSVVADSETAIESEKKDTLVFSANRDKETSKGVSTTEKKGFTETAQGDIIGQLLPISFVDIIPEDMSIGTLLDMKMLDNSPDSFANAIVTFFKEAQKGEISEDILHPTWSTNIIRLYKDRLFEVNYTLRIGTIIKKNGISAANIRLISDTGRVSGDIMADNYKGKWLLSSISVDMNQLENIYFRENLEFTPLSYSNILLNY